MFLSFAIQCGSIAQFIDHWSAVYGKQDYNHRDRNYYDPYVGKLLTTESRRRLFEWKNGTTLSASKLASIEKHDPVPGEPAKLEEYLDPKGPGGPIWNIFYMHCVDPEVWPIFDQHTFRAMKYLETEEIQNIEDIVSSKAHVFCFYHTQYIPFVKKLGPTQRKIDQALYSFGRFLKKAEPFS